MKEELKNENRSMMKSDYGNTKADKSNELNESMTIKETPQDEYTQQLHNLGGSK